MKRLKFILLKFITKTLKLPENTFFLPFNMLSVDSQQFYLKNYHFNTKYVPGLNTMVALSHEETIDKYNNLSSKMTIKDCLNCLKHK